MNESSDQNWSLEITAEANGRLRKPTINVRGPDNALIFTDTANLRSAAERTRVCNRIAKQLKAEPEKVQSKMEEAWNDLVQQQEIRQSVDQSAARAQLQQGTTAELLDRQPEEIRRPLALVGGRAYAVAWCIYKIAKRASFDESTQQVIEHDPPLVLCEPRTVIVSSDGRLFADGEGISGALPWKELGLQVSLPGPIPPGCGWSGRGVKRYVAGERPNPTDVFERLVRLIDRFIDFARSLGSQHTMCEFVASYIIGTYFLDAFTVVGYLWPNGERGAGKTTLIHLVAEIAYLGQLILAGSSFPTLRDMADYGATLAFDDAEDIMDVRRTDPDKRTLLLAGNRRGATVAVKELQGDKWHTRYLNTFCPRLFSAIRLPDPVLGSRTITLPLVRSGDEARTKATVADHTTWPCDRQELLDDLWALGLQHLPVMPGHDREAASLASLSGRSLEPWRVVLGVAHWLEKRHSVEGLFDRMEKLSRSYQAERSDYEEHDATRVLFRAMLKLLEKHEPWDSVVLRPGEIAALMNDIAKEEDLCEPEKPFTNARKVGWMLKRHRFKRPHGTGRDASGKQWQATCDEIVEAARAYGVEPSSAPTGGTVESPPNACRTA
jgi:hypothetical protein